MRDWSKQIITVGNGPGEEVDDVVEALKLVRAGKAINFQGAGSTCDFTPNGDQLGIIRGRRWKYVHFAALPSLLFDLENDPTEMNNLAQDPKHASVVLDYAQRMLSWRMRYAERTLTNLHLWREGVLDRRAVAR